MRIVLPLLIVINLSCNHGQEDNRKRDFEFYPQIQDSINYKEAFLKEKEIDSKIFNLPSLFKGSQDSLEIRIWPSRAFDFWKKVFIFRMDSTGWHGYHYFSYTLPIIDQEGKTMIFSDVKKIGDSVFIVKDISPLCGWKKFLDSINFFGIKYLPTQDSIKNFKAIGHTDGDHWSFEIATPTFYRYLYYDIPDIYQYKECKLIAGFIEMLKRQLENDYYWPRQWLSSNNKKSPQTN
jgi:hypothetical protein